MADQYMLAGHLLFGNARSSQHHPSDEDLSLRTPGAAMNGAQPFGR